MLRRDGTVRAAIAYWVDGDTLHYVTTEGSHNRASLDLVPGVKQIRRVLDAANPLRLAGRALQALSLRPRLSRVRGR